MAFIDLEKLECPICQDVFTDACETSCGHGFCEFCLNQCLEKKPGVCPVCQKNPSPVHPSYSLRTIVESIGRNKDDSSSSSTSSDTSSSVERERADGNISYNQKKYADAIMHYTKALHSSLKNGASNERDAVLYNNRAQCYIKIEEYRRALDDCDEAIRLDPTDVKAYMRRGLCSFKLGDFEKSRKAYLKAKQLDTSGLWRDVVNEALASLPNPRPPFHQYPPQPPVPPAPVPPVPPQQYQYQQQQHQQQQQQQRQYQQQNVHHQRYPYAQNGQYPGQFAYPPPPAAPPQYPPHQSPVSCSTQ